MRARLLPALLWAWFGVLSTLVGVAVGHLVASLLDPASSPVLAVGSAVIDLTPTPLKEYAIRTFGSNDKTILVGSVLAGVIVLAAVAGVLARKRLLVGIGMLVVLVGVAGVAILTRPAVSFEDVVPVVATLITGPASLWFLGRTSNRGGQAAGARSESDVPEGKGGRRGLLIGMGVMAAAAAVMGSAGKIIGDLRSKAENLALPKATDVPKPLPTGLEQKYKAITPLQTSTADFYRVDTRLDVPIVDSDGWTLTIDGDVDNEVELTLDDLFAMEVIERDITMTCVSNSVGGEYVGAARWLGVRLTDVLDKAGIGNTSADQILSTDFDGMTISTPLELATDGRDAMIVFGMNGDQLPREHGFPVRMIVPGLYGFISGTKWLSKLTLTTYDDASAYWTDRDWDTKAPIKISTRIDTPQALAQLDSGDNIIGGVAWAQQSGGVKTVQVQVDGGGWEDAKLGPDVNNDYWRQWYYEWKGAEAGSHQLEARVIDGDGETQTAARANPFPGGSSGVQSITVTVGG